MNHVIELSKVKRHLHYRAGDLRRKHLIERAYGVVYRGKQEDVADLVVESINCGVRIGLYCDSASYPKTEYMK